MPLVHHYAYFYPCVCGSKQGDFLNQHLSGSAVPQIATGLIFKLNTPVLELGASSRHRTNLWTSESLYWHWDWKQSQCQAKLVWDLMYKLAKLIHWYQHSQKISDCSHECIRSLVLFTEGRACSTTSYLSTTWESRSSFLFINVRHNTHIIGIRTIWAGSFSSSLWCHLSIPSSWTGPCWRDVLCIYND